MHLVYFLHLPTRGAIKIGCTYDLANRWREHAHTLGSIVFLGAMAGDPEVEDAVHARFAPLRQERRSELFAVHDQLLAFIGTVRYLRIEDAAAASDDDCVCRRCALQQQWLIRKARTAAAATPRRLMIPTAPSSDRSLTLPWSR